MTDRSLRLAVVAGLLVAAVAIVYAQTLGFAFVEWDDPTYVTENPAVQARLSWGGVVWAFSSAWASNWHPLTWLSHMLDQSLFDGWAGGHHLTSVVLHAANTVLVFLLFARTTGAVGRSAFVAGLFALHPLHVESVAWVSERKDVLSTCFALLALHAWVGWARTRRPAAYALALAAFVLACLAKPMVVTLPGLVLLLDVWPLGRLMRAGAPPAKGRPAPPTRAAIVVETLPFVAVAVVMSVVTVLVQGRAVAESAALPFSERLGNALVSWVAYVWSTVWPVGLAFFYPYRAAAGPWLAIGAAVALLAATGGAVRMARTHPYVLVGWLWYVGTLLPVIGLVQAGDQAMADRFTYVPLIGLFVIVAWGAGDLAARWRIPLVAQRAAGGVALAACAALSMRQAATWRASEPLFEHALAVTRDNYVAHNLLGYVRFGQRRLDEAGGHFAAAVAARPTMHEAHNNLGLVLANQGRFAEAIPHYRTSIALRPDWATAHFNLAIALARTGAPDEARAEGQRALALARAQGDGALAAQITQLFGAR